MNREIDGPVFGRQVEGCEYIIRPSAYGLVRREADELAIARTAVGYFLPGGGLKTGETSEQAIEREAMEECGLVLRPRFLVGRAVQIVYSPAENACFEKQCSFLEADLIGLESPTDGDHQLVWFNVRHAVEALFHESHRWAVGRLIAKNA